VNQAGAPGSFEPPPGCTNSGAPRRSRRSSSGPSTSPDGRDALAYAHALPGLFPGERPSLQGIRGYVTGPALTGAVRRGTRPAEIARALRRPRPFTDALAAPWRADAPSLGGQRFTMLGTRFQSATLIPPSAGGEAYSGTLFPDGAWNRLSSELYGPPLTSRRSPRSEIDRFEG
jgi:hypothetical protein